MRLIFLGTNGWYDTPTGNTLCILLETQKETIILDAGNGLHKIDRYLNPNKPIYLFLSHFHLDHVVGLHILNKFNLSRGMEVYGPPGAKKLLAQLIRQPFTADLKTLNTPLRIHDRLSLSALPFPVESRKLAHVAPCYGYRFTLENKIITYCTDTGPCHNLGLLAREADLLITECAYKGGETTKWPHLNPLLAAQAAKEAGAKKLVLVHFDASLYTTLKARREAQAKARKIFPNTLAARDDLEISI